MDQMITKGFCTLATGDDKFYILAANLLTSYKYQVGADVLPFAIIADRYNKYTELFDDVVILQHPSMSYLDKIEMLASLPYDLTIFIDSDSLCYGNINRFFDYCAFQGVQQIGSIFSLDASDGVWFTQKDVGDYANLVHFLVHSYGGMMFIRNDDLTQKIYKTCLEIKDRYMDLHFSIFSKPADEPIIALSDSIHNCPPVNLPRGLYLFLPDAISFSANILEGNLEYLDKYTKERYSHVLLLHFKTDNTIKPFYKKEVYSLSHGRISTFLAGGWFTCVYFIKLLKWNMNTFIYKMLQKFNT